VTRRTLTLRLARKVRRKHAFSGLASRISLFANLL